MNEASSRTTGCVLLRQAGINPPVLYSLPLCRLLRNCTPHSPCTESCLHVHVCFQRVTYETKKPTHDVRTIADVEGGVVKAGKMVEWKEQIIVPPLPQSSLTGCELIKIEYYVKVRYAHPLLRHPVLYCGHGHCDRVLDKHSTFEGCVCLLSISFNQSLPLLL